jgi:hypothetical protein
MTEKRRQAAALQSPSQAAKGLGVAAMAISMILCLPQLLFAFASTVK